jgi:GT2 family glycosyltransferase
LTSAAIRVAVCTNRSPAAIEPCLRALAGTDLLLVTSGLDERAAGAHERALAELHPGATLLRESRPGLSRARNAALAACADDDVLAFVDDDALVAPDWLEKLGAAWDAAPERVACIGGPIRPRFEEERPSWLTDYLLPALTVLDRGDAPLDLDPEVATVYGANISFRVGPLRSVGGFDPEYGHSGGTVWFSEEDEAQRALADAGFGVRYDPGPWVWHVIGPERVRPGAFLRRRFRYGATLRARGMRSPGVAARQAFSSGLGAGAAFVVGDRPLGMERATRAAENLGALVARR